MKFNTLVDFNCLGILRLVYHGDTKSNDFLSVIEIKNNPIKLRI